MSRTGSYRWSPGYGTYRDPQLRQAPQVITAPSHPTLIRNQKIDTYANHPHQMNGSHAHIRGGHSQLNGAHPQSYVINPSTNGTYPQMMRGHPQMNGNSIQSSVGQPHINGGHPPSNGIHPGHPHVNSLDSEQNRAVREAFRKERKIDSYLADDLNFPSFAKRLKEMGLQLRDIPADGNCLFRALGDQLEGHCRNHYRHRQELVQFMLEHRKDFEPFVEDDMPFEDHITNLRKLGTHAGNDAIVAFARLHNVNVVIHQLRGDPIQILGPSSSPHVRQVHIAYHNGDHYSSVRRDGDNTESPANIRAQLSKQSVPVPTPQPSSDTSGMVTAKRGLEHLEAEVLAATGCQDVASVREILKQTDYDVDAAIATLLQSLDLQDGKHGGDDTTSLASHQTTDSGIWAANQIMGGGVSRASSVKSKGQKVHFREDSFGGSSGYSSMGSNRGSGARPRLQITGPATPVQYQIVTGRKAKELRKLEKKRKL